MSDRKILMISFEDLRYSGRTKELYAVCQKLGTTYLMVKNAVVQDEFVYVMKTGGMSGFRQYISKAKEIIQSKKIDILLIDNRLACVVGLALKRKYPKLILIQDARELYLLDRKSSLKSNIGTVIEQSLMKKADIVICANKYRAKIMKDRFKLREKPVVFENRWKLPVAYHEKDYKEKYRWLEELDLPVVISTYGCTEDRGNIDLLQDFARIDQKAALLFVGGEPARDKALAQKIIKEKNIGHVYMMDKVPGDELQYLISISRIGIVNYGMYDENNKYCASGKIYEFLHQGKPVVTTLNPPLKDLCDQSQVGVSVADYAEGITKVLENYDYYVSHIEPFLKEHTVEANNEKLYEDLTEKLRSCRV